MSRRTRPGDELAEPSELVRFIEEESRSGSLECLAQLHAGMVGQHDEAAVRCFGADLAQNFQSGPVGKLVVEHDEIGLRGLDFTDRGSRGIGFADDADRRAYAQQLLQPLANGSRIVDQYDRWGDVVVHGATVAE